MRAIVVPPTPYNADTLDSTQRVTHALVVPYAAFVASPGCATVLPSVPLSRLDARACRALQYHPQYAPLPRRAPPSFLIAGVACVALSSATTIYCSYPSMQAAGTCGCRSSNAHVVFVASPHVLAILSAVPLLRSNLPMAVPRNTCTDLAGVRFAYRGTPYTSPTHGLRPASHSANMTRTTTSVRSNAAAVPHHPRHFLLRLPASPTSAA
ncbi:hypothetical protein B0H14DRAFT_3881358 [Mycena olivaceomarginata]|nr:hypothetical protein B0H14DRAFT_3881358 [Mycena olivaceomarginata]